MRIVLLELSKYGFAFLIMFYTAVSCYGAACKNESRKRVTYVLQNVFMFSIHILGYFILYIR